MARKPSPYWTCRSRPQHGTVVCGYRNLAADRKCSSCGVPKPPKRKPKHMVALEADYETYILLNDGDHCGICLRRRTDADRRFDRDHDHRTGRPRGLLCHKCNRALPSWMTPEWLLAAAEYLRKRGNERG